VAQTYFFFCLGRILCFKQNCSAEINYRAAAAEPYLIKRGHFQLGTAERTTEPPKKGRGAKRRN